MINIKIQEIRAYLQNNPQYFSSKNTCSIEDIKSQNKYYFIADCEHEFFSLPCNVFKKEKINCPVCSGHQVVKGVNDLWTTHPLLASMLQNPEDGYLYSVGSNKKLNWVCPECGAIASRSPNKMSQNVSCCQECNKLSSYGEKFMVALLTQLCEVFEKEKIFDWSEDKRYDFYLPCYGCIIEIHGIQHYCDKDFSRCGGRSYIEEQMNDQYKKELALKNGIQEYIIIENKKSDMDTIQQNILSSLLPTILNFSKNDVDWDECHNFCLTNAMKLICEYYDNIDKDLNNISDFFGYSYNTIKKYLKDGAKINICSYSPEASKKLGIEKAVNTMLKNRTKAVLQIDKNSGRIINEFESIQSAQRELKISHIWDCLIGKRNTAGGYAWKYKYYECK